MLLKCRECKKLISHEAAVCPNCCVPKPILAINCRKCGERTPLDGEKCLKCGKGSPRTTKKQDLSGYVWGLLLLALLVYLIAQGGEQKSKGDLAAGSPGQSGHEQASLVTSASGPSGEDEQVHASAEKRLPKDAREAVREARRNVLLLLESASDSPTEREVQQAIVETAYTLADVSSGRFTERDISMELTRRGYPHDLLRKTDPSPSAAWPVAKEALVAEGRDLVERIAEARMIEFPDRFLRGAAKSDPRVAIALPDGEWAKLNEEERATIVEYLRDYIPSCIDDPARAARLPNAAEGIRSVFEKNVATMTGEHWVVLEGRVRNREILIDRSVAEGAIR